LGTWRKGDLETWGRRGPGEEGTRGRGDLVKRGLAEEGTWRLGDLMKKRLGKKETW